MPIQGLENEYDSGVPLRFAWQYLTADTDFQSLYDGKLFEAVRIPPKPGDDFVIVKAWEEEIALWGGRAEFIGKVNSRLEVICVKKYPNGLGSEMDFRTILKILRRALCHRNGVAVYLDGDAIGTVDESRYMGTIPMYSHSDGNFDVLHKGISVRVVHR